MLGCDIIELSRIRKSYETYGDKFVRRILSKEELEIFFKRSNKVEFLAGRFSAKEAISKALKTGIRGELSFDGISILPDEFGALEVYINGELKENIQVSISHCKEYAMSVSMIKND